MECCLMNTVAAQMRIDRTQAPVLTAGFPRMQSALSTAAASTSETSTCIDGRMQAGIVGLSMLYRKPTAALSRFSRGKTAGRSSCVLGYSVQTSMLTNSAM